MLRGSQTSGIKEEEAVVVAMLQASFTVDQTIPGLCQVVGVKAGLADREAIVAHVYCPVQLVQGGGRFATAAAPIIRDVLDTFLDSRRQAGVRGRGREARASSLG